MPSTRLLSAPRCCCCLCCTGDQRAAGRVGGGTPVQGQVGSFWGELPFCLDHCANERMPCTPRRPGPMLPCSSAPWHPLPTRAPPLPPLPTSPPAALLQRAGLCDSEPVFGGSGQAVPSHQICEDCQHRRVLARVPLGWCGTVRELSPCLSLRACLLPVGAAATSGCLSAQALPLAIARSRAAPVVRGPARLTCCRSSPPLPLLQSASLGIRMSTCPRCCSIRTQSVCRRWWGCATLAGAAPARSW